MLRVLGDKDAEKRRRNKGTHIKCGHCNNNVYMKEIIRHSQIRSRGVDEWQFQAGPVWTLLECAICSGITLLRLCFDELSMPEDWEVQVLFPPVDTPPGELPAEVAKEYQEALRLRHISPNAYAVALGRVALSTNLLEEFVNPDLRKPLL